MGDILVPYILPFLGFKDYSINGCGPPTAAKLPLYLCLIRQIKVHNGPASADATTARDGIFTKLLALASLVHMAATHWPLQRRLGICWP